MTMPGPGRTQLGFAEAAVDQFGFLVDELGFRLVRVESTLVRYESPRAFVNVFHGRASYELGVEIGRWIEMGGARVEQKYPLSAVIALDHDPTAVGVHPFATTDGAVLGRFVVQLAELTRRYGELALSGDPTTFDRLSAENARRSDAFTNRLRAQRLRSVADDAWRRKDWGLVIDAYREIESELLHVELKPSESGRLRYAQKRLGSAR